MLLPGYEVIIPRFKPLYLLYAKWTGVTAFKKRIPSCFHRAGSWIRTLLVWAEHADHYPMWSLSCLAFSPLFSVILSTRTLPLTSPAFYVIWLKIHLNFIQICCRTIHRRTFSLCIRKSTFGFLYLHWSFSNILHHQLNRQLNRKIIPPGIDDDISLVQECVWKVFGKTFW